MVPTRAIAAFLRVHLPVMYWGFVSYGIIITSFWMREFGTRFVLMLIGLIIQLWVLLANRERSSDTDTHSYDFDIRNSRDVHMILWPSILLAVILMAIAGALGVKFLSWISAGLIVLFATGLFLRCWYRQEVASGNE